MIAGDALEAWFADRARQQQSRRDADTFSGRWVAHPLTTELRAELTALRARTATSIMAAAERFMARSDEIGLMIEELIAASSADPFFRPPLATVFSEINNGFLLYGDADLTIALGVSSADALAAKKSGARGPASIVFTGLLTRFQWLRAGGATVSFWEAPEIRPGFTVEASGTCRLAERRRVEDGEAFVMDGRCQSFVIEHASSDMVCLQAAVLAGSAPLAVEYDSKSLAFAGASSTDEASSRVQMMVTLLRLMERNDALPIVESLLASPHFYTRWHLMREMLAMDAEFAHPHLVRMAETDPHPEVRAAAAQVLDLFFSNAEEAA
jgi:hypothetical protein